MGNKSCKCGKKIEVIVSLISLHNNDLSIDDIERETTLRFVEKDGCYFKELCRDCFNNKFNIRKSYFAVRGWRYNISFVI